MNVRLAPSWRCRAPGGPLSWCNLTGIFSIIEFIPLGIVKNKAVIELEGITGAIKIVALRGLETTRVLFN